MDKFIELVKARRSIRKFKEDSVPIDLLTKCIEAARFAPTACNTQSWRFIVTEGDTKERLVRESLGGIIVPNKFAFRAPVIVVIAMDLDLVTHRLGGTVKGIDYHLIDAGIAGEHFVLQATELGLGTCWIGWFDKKAVKSVLKLSRGWEVAAMIVVGYPEGKPPPKERKSIGEIVKFMDR